jgi:hypothetical protein
VFKRSEIDLSSFAKGENRRLGGGNSVALAFPRFPSWDRITVRIEYGYLDYVDGKGIQFIQISIVDHTWRDRVAAHRVQTCEGSKLNPQTGSHAPHSCDRSSLSPNAVVLPAVNSN